MRANKFFLTRRLWNKGLLFKTCLMLILSTSASLASICSLVHGNCEDYDARGTSHPAYVGSDVSNFVSDKQDGISGCAGFSDKGAAPHANGAQWPAYARKNSANNTAQYVCSACKKTVNNSEVVVVDAQGYARWNCYRKCDDVSNTGADYVADYGTSTVSKYANLPYRDRFVRSQAQCNERYPKVAGSNEWPTKYVEITPNVCGRCKPIEELTDDEKCDDGLALSSYPTDYPCYYACKKPYTLKDGTECCAASSWEKMPEDYHREFWTGKCYNTKTEEAASGGNCYKQTEIRVRTATASAPLYVPMGDDEDLGENTSGTTSSGSVERETDEDEVVCDAGKVWNDYNKSYDSAQEACACVFEKCEGNTVRGGEDGVTCVACGGILQANADHTACGCPEGTAENDSGECVCTREGAEIVDGTCMCPAGTYATTVQRAPNCPPGKHCSLETVMVCIPCEDDTYTGEPNLNASCTSCSEGFVPNEDHTACVCANGGELIDGECKCPQGQIMYNEQCIDDPCGVGRSSIACSPGTSSGVVEKTEFSCRWCIPAGTVRSGTYASMSCYQRGTTTCGDGYSFEVTKNSCTAQGKFALFENEPVGPCGLCAKCVDEDPCTTANAAWVSEIPSPSAYVEDNTCYYYQNANYIGQFVQYLTAGNKCFVRNEVNIGPTEEECAAMGATRAQEGDDTPCGKKYVCKCPTGTSLNDDNTQCVCDNGGELIDGECKCPTGKVLYNGTCTTDSCGGNGRTAVACTSTNGIEEKTGSSCRWCIDAGTVDGNSGSMKCYMRFTDTCATGYSFLETEASCAAQNKVAVYQAENSLSPCLRLCVKCECPIDTTAADNGECICNNGGDFVNGLCVPPR